MDCATASNGAHVILGASGGIGSAVARRLAARGERVLLAGRDRERLEALDLPASRTFVLDVRDWGQIDACLAAGADLGGGRVAGVAHCVGSVVLKPAHRTTPAEWDEIVALNLTSAVALVAAAGRRMRDGGALVFCSSAAARTGLANHDAIAAAKAGLLGLVRSAAATYASRGLRCNAVAPGLVRTPLARAITDNPRALQQSERMHPLGRIGEPDEVAAAIVWLLDPTNSWITGEVLGVDGGLAGARPVPRE